MHADQLRDPTGPDVSQPLSVDAAKANMYLEIVVRGKRSLCHDRLRAKSRGEPPPRSDGSELESLLASASMLREPHRTSVVAAVSSWVRMLVDPELPLTWTKGEAPIAGAMPTGPDADDKRTDNVAPSERMQDAVASGPRARPAGPRFLVRVRAMLTRWWRRA